IARELGECPGHGPELSACADGLSRLPDSGVLDRADESRRRPGPVASVRLRPCGGCDQPLDGLKTSEFGRSLPDAQPATVMGRCFVPPCMANPPRAEGYVRAAHCTLGAGTDDRRRLALGGVARM